MPAHTGNREGETCTRISRLQSLPPHGKQWETQSHDRRLPCMERQRNNGSMAPVFRDDAGARQRDRVGPGLRKRGGSLASIHTKKKRRKRSPTIRASRTGSPAITTIDTRRQNTQGVCIFSADIVVTVCRLHACASVSIFVCVQNKLSQMSVNKISDANIFAFHRVFRKKQQCCPVSETVWIKPTTNGPAGLLPGKMK